MSRFINIAGYVIDMQEVSHTYEPQNVMYADVIVTMKCGAIITIGHKDKKEFKTKFEGFIK